MTDQRLKDLFERHRLKVCTPAEKQELAMLCLLPDNKVAVEELVSKIWEKTEMSAVMPAEKGEVILQLILEEEKLAGTGEEENVSSEWSIVSWKEKVQLWKRIAVAASIIGVLFVAGYFIVSRESSGVSGDPSTALRTNDVKAPDKNRAQIKLADGSVIYLDSAGNGELANVNGVKVVKTEDGKIEYSRESGVVSGELDYNTLSNPRGSKVIDMTLSDGSRVWLNAGSSVTYPVTFVGNERKVSIDGEAYFEISRQTTDNGRRLKTFIVEKGNMQVEVLGTHFNVNAYDDEREIKVTLLEGSVRVQSSVVSSESVVIKPGEQAKVTGNGQLAISKGVDVEAVMAWKNGRFQFEGAGIEEVMRQIARWYDVEVVYEVKPKEVHFRGGISREVEVSRVFKMLETTGAVHFRIEGKKVVVIR